MHLKTKVQRILIMVGCAILFGLIGYAAYFIVNDTLILSGRLPSFYLKQVLQTIMKNVPGVTHIVNQVDVVSPRGLSSITTHL